MAGLYEDQISGAKQRLETARRLRESSFGQYPQGQFIGNYYAAPHWTNHLANALRQIQLGNQEQEATQELQDVSRKQAQDTIRSMNAAGIPASENMLRQAQEPEKIPGFIDRASAFLRGEEAPQPVPTQPFQQNIAKDLTPEQRDAAYIQLISTNPELGKSIIDYQKAQSAMDSQSMRRARLGIPQGFDMNEQGQLVPMPVEGGGNFLNTVLPAQAQARGSFVTPVQQHQMNVADAQLQLQQAKDLREQQKEQRALEKETPQQIKEDQRIQDAQDALAITKEAAPLISQATGSGVGAGVDYLAGLVGKSTKGADAAAQLKVLGGALVAKMPKMSGPQSDKDVLLYKEMAGRIGDPTVPASQKQAAIQTINEMQKRYSGAQSKVQQPQGGSSVDDLVKKYGGQ